MTHYLKRIVKLTDSLNVTPKGLGYTYWLAAGRTSTGWMASGFLNRFVVEGGSVAVVEGPGDGFVIHVHPFIKATAQHAEALGVEVGQAIAGIRWVDGGIRSMATDTGANFDNRLEQLEAEAVESDRTAAEAREALELETAAHRDRHKAAADRLIKANAEADKPQQGKVYALFTDGTTPSIANGNTWAESEVEEDDND